MPNFIAALLKIKAYSKYAILLLEYYLTIKSIKPMTPNEEKFIEIVVEAYDDLTNTGMIDKVDHLILKPVLKNLYKVMKAKANSKIKKIMEAIADAVATKDTKQIETNLVFLANAKLDIPGMDEQQEQEIFASQINTLALIVKNYLSKL